MYMCWTAPQSIDPMPQRHYLSHFPQQPLSPNLHAPEGEPFLAQVLQRGPDMINGVVDAEEAVVGVLELSQNLRQLPVLIWLASTMLRSWLAQLRDDAKRQKPQ